MTRNILIISGIILSMALIFLRLEGKSRVFSTNLGMLSDILGYHGTKTYALFLLDNRKEPLLFILKITDGATVFTNVSSGEDMFAGYSEKQFIDAAPALIEKISPNAKSDDLDAIGFITSDAAGLIANASKGISFRNQSINSGNLDDIIWEIARKENAANMLNNSLSLSMKKLFIHGKSLMSAAKEILLKESAAIYFTRSKPTGKSCIGACKKTMRDYLFPSSTSEQI